MKNLKNHHISVFGDSISKGLFLNGSHIERTSTNAIQLVENRYGIEIENNSCFGQTLKRLCQKGGLKFSKSNLPSNIDQTAELSKKSSGAVFSISANLAQSKNPNKNFAVISLGGNDSDFNWKTVAQDPTLDHDSVTPLKLFKNLLMDCVDQCKKNNVQPILATIVPVDGEKYFHYVISKQCDGGAVLKFLKNDLHVIFRHQQLYSDTISEVACQKNCPLLNIREEFLKLEDFSTLLCDDGIHPNEKGHLLMANKICQFIENYN